MAGKIAPEPGFYAGQFRKAGQGYVAEVTLDEMSKDELLAEAAERGISVKPSDTKAEIIAALSAST